MLIIKKIIYILYIRLEKKKLKNFVTFYNYIGLLCDYFI